MKIKKYKLYFWLFYVNFFISAFTFGGGYVVIPMIRKYFVEVKDLISESELLDMAAIAQSSPGAIAVNLSVLAGYKVLKLKGAIISCISSVLPPLIILSIISFAYSEFHDNNIIAAILKGMEAGVAAIIIDLAIDMCRAIFKEKHLLLSFIVPVAFIASFFFNINVIFIIIFSSTLCFLEALIKKKKRGSKLC